jgi:hypothetical protein
MTTWPKRRNGNMAQTKHVEMREGKRWADVAEAFILIAYLREWAMREGRMIR